LSIVDNVAWEITDDEERRSTKKNKLSRDETIEGSKVETTRTMMPKVKNALLTTLMMAIET
jgi:hypothetical protein